MISLKVLALATVSALAFSICDSMAAGWARDGSTRSLLLVLFLGPVGYLIFGLLNVKTELAVAGGLVNGLIIVFTSLAGYIFFRQGLKIHQLAGVSLIVIGVLVASYSAPERDGVETVAKSE